MTVSYLTKTDLAKEDGVKNLDTDVKKALLNALYDDGVYDHSGDPHKTAVFQDDLDQGKVDPTTQILELDTSGTVDTTPSLKAIILDDTAGGPHGGDGNARDLTVTGSSVGNSIFVATGNAGDTVTLQDSGNDTVYGGGHALIDASAPGTGNDSLVGYGGYGGYDTIYGGSGQDTLIGSAGHDSLVAGTGTHQSLQGAGGNDNISDPNKDTLPHYDTLIGSGGNDTITGQQGDYLQETGNKGSQFWLYGSSDTMAGSMLQGGKGDDTFHIETNVGNDTIIGGGGKDIVDFDMRTYSDYQSASLDKVAGGYTLTFSDGQQFHLSGISELHFSDNHTVTLK
jgi:Ca2+-binding RTX toxin-like protein